MDYSAVSRRATAAAGSPWGLDDIGLDRHHATAAMIKRAMAYQEWEAELLLRDILAGRWDPQKPKLLGEGDEHGGVWFCITQEDRQPPEPPRPVIAPVPA